MFRDGDGDGVVHAVTNMAGAGVGDVNLNEREMIQFLMILPVANRKVKLLLDLDDVEVRRFYLEAVLFSCPDVNRAKRIRRI